jgi:uncharacterized membrane protein
MRIGHRRISLPTERFGHAVHKMVNVLVPIVGLGLMVFYELCNTACASLQGELLGVDLKLVGILFMAVLLAIVPLHRTRFSALAGHLKTLLLAGALGGEIMLVRFQIIHEAYCPFCLAFGLCIVILFFANFSLMNKYLVLVAFLTGIGAFALFFTGSVLPLYR